MKNKIIQCFGLLIAVFFATGCQTLDEPEFGDYPLDPPIITLNTPNASGSTVIRSSDPIAPLTFKFQVEDDIEIVNITVNVDGVDVLSMNEFTNGKLVIVDDLVYEASTGTHTLIITAIDSDGNVTTLSTTFEKEDAPPYNPRFAGEVFYMNFEGNYTDLASNIDATAVGSPGFAGEAKVGTDAYKGATESYLTFPADGLLGSEFSAAFWYKLDTSEGRAGILTATDNDDRNQGFRLFREGSATTQTIKLNVGTGDGDSWNDGGAIEVTGEWVHIAFSISATNTVFYVNGIPLRTGTLPKAIDWTGVEELVIGSGLNFSGWGHNSETSPIDDLRLFNTVLTQSVIQNIINASDETLYMPFDGQYNDMVSNREVTVVGTPEFAGESKVGSDAYAGAADSYLTLPSAGLLSEEFSTTFWYKVNASPDRAGIIVISAVNESNPDGNNLNYGFHLFREGNATEQRIKASVGTGTGQIWNDGGVINVAAGEWVHVAFTISNSESKIYLNGVLAKTSTVTGGVDWTGADLVSIMSGAPRFTEWGHLSDSSFMDELRFYNKALTQEEIQAAMAD